MSNHFKGIPTLIATTNITTDVSEVVINSGIDSTYDEHMFVFTGIVFSADNGNLAWQCNATGETGYNEQWVNTVIRARLFEGNSGAEVTYQTGYDTVGTGSVYCTGEVGSDSDQCVAGFFHLFQAHLSTAVTQFTSRFNISGQADSSEEWVSGGYTSATNAVVSDIKFICTSGNFTAGTIQHFGIE